MTATVLHNHKTSCTAGGAYVAAREEAIASYYFGLVMLIFEDLPEITLDIVYFAQRSVDALAVRL